jgi:hypothetical protein
VNTDRGIFFFLPKYSVKTLLWVLASSFGTAFILGFFSVFLGVTTVSDGMFVGFLAWLGFTAPTQYSYVLWKKSSFKLFFIETGCSLLAYLSMGGIIGA